MNRMMLYEDNLMIRKNLRDCGDVHRFYQMINQMKKLIKTSEMNSWKDDTSIIKIA
jgi:hypothetical protein